MRDPEFEQTMRRARHVLSLPDAPASLKKKAARVVNLGEKLLALEKHRQKLRQKPDRST